MRQYRKLTIDQVRNLKRLIRDFPELTNEQIGQLVGCSDSTVSVERRGVRTPKSDVKRAAFEAARKSIAGPLPSMEDDEPSKGPLSTIPGDSSALAPSSAPTSAEHEARKLTAEIRLQALKRLRQQLTEGQLSPDDVLAALGDQP